MNLEKLDLIRECELEIDKIKKRIMERPFRIDSHMMLNLTAYEEHIDTSNITIKALKERRNRLVEEYGERYEKDRQLYDRITYTDDLRREVRQLKSKVNQLDEINKTLENKAVVYREEDNNCQLENSYKILSIGVFIISIAIILILISVK